MQLAASALLEAILTGSRHPLMLLSREGTVLEANHALLSVLALPRGEVLGRALGELPLWHGASAPDLADSIGEFSFLSRGWLFSIRPVPGSGLFIAEGQDHAAVEAEKNRARLVFELAQMGVWTWDLASDSISNQSERGIFGWTPMRNASRQEAMERIHPEDRAYVLAQADAAVASRSGFRVEVRGLVRGTGELRWVAITGTVRCDENGEPLRVDGITVDITERKETEFRLRESEARFRAIFQNAGIGIGLLSPDNLVIEANPATEQLLGYSPQELRKMHFGGLVHPDDLHRGLELFQQLTSGVRRNFQMEVRFIRKDGEVLWGKVVVSAVRDASGKVVFGIGMLEDVTQRRKAEQELLSLSDKLIHTQELERSRIARELHDGLGQQLAALSISVSSLKRQIPEQDTESRDRLTRLQQRIGAVAEGVRRISHELHPAVLELAGIVPALRSYCNQFSADNQMAVALEASDDLDNLPPEVALCLYRVAQEALQNAAKHSGAKEASVQLKRSEDGVVLAVVDRGRGFDAAVPLQHAGLGLVSMKERARLLNGRLRVSSSPGHGVVLEVSIPLATLRRSAQPA